MSEPSVWSTEVLQRTSPALFANLSALARRLTFPHGIPWQSEQAKATRYNATIGQVTDGAGNPQPLGAMERVIGALDRKMTLLYAPQSGHVEVRKLWWARQQKQAGRAQAPWPLPYATHGLTHGLSIMADLFVEADTTVVIPVPSWENYQLVLGMRTGPKVVTWDMIRGDALDVDALKTALSGVSGRTVIVLNFPNNPTGYVPTPAEVEALRDVVLAHPGPTVVLIDDAYLGVVHAEGRDATSLFWPLAEAADPARTLVVKVDGATKELLFFPSRVGFVTASVTGEAIAAWEDKLQGLVRGTVGSAAGPSQAIMLSMLREGDQLVADTAERLAEITARYRVLRESLDALKNPRVHVMPFHGAYFATIQLQGVDADRVRRRLIEERSVGVVALPEVNGIRVAFCSTRLEDLPAIVSAIDEVVASEP